LSVLQHYYVGYPIEEKEEQDSSFQVLASGQPVAGI